MGNKTKKTGTFVFFLVILLLGAMAVVSVRIIQPRIEQSRLDEVTSVTALVTPETLADMDKYANLEYADFTGSTCYDELADWESSHPNVTVKYSVDLGGTAVSNDVAELSLADGAYDYAKLTETLGCFTRLEKISLPATSLSADELSALQSAVPEADVDFSAIIGGREVKRDDAEVDISGISHEQLDEAGAFLRLLPKLETLVLTGEDGSSTLSVDDALAVKNDFPGVSVRYSFELFGKTLSSADDRIVYTSVDLGDDSLAEFERVLPLLESLEYLKLDSCNIDYELLAEFRAAHADEFKTVWRVWFGYYNCLTDIKTVLATGYYPEGEGYVLKYCNEVEYLDLGHNPQLKNVDFISYMPNLRVCILADSHAASLEPFANCKNLEWLELMNVASISDLSPLASCTALKGLNIVLCTAVKDLSPLYGLENMERLYLGKLYLSADQQKGIQEALPDCWISFNTLGYGNVSMNYGIGWRLEKDGSRAEWYQNICDIFRYDSYDTEDRYWTHDEGWEW